MKRQRKMASISISGDIDLSPILPIVDTPVFQSLARKRQLGLAYLLFRDANHTRFSHSLGVYAATLKRAQLWIRMNLIEKEEAWNLCLFGLLHDIGHGPYSHVIEPLCSYNHEVAGLHRLDELSTPITQSGGDVEAIKELFREDNKLSDAVLHGPLGTDKIDYLDRDAMHTHIAGRPPVKTILHYTYFDHGTLTIDPKIVTEVMQLQMFYMYMYHRVYLRKMSLIAQRYFQRMVAELLNPSIDMSPELTEDILWQLDDGEIDGVIHFSQNPIVQHWRENLSIRKLPRVAVSLRRHANDEPTTKDKRIAAFSLPSPTMTSILHKLDHPETLRMTEKAIDDLMNLPAYSTLLVPTLSAKRAFEPEDILVAYSDKLHSLEERNPGHYAALRERAQSYPAIYVCTPEEYRDRASDPSIAEQIYNLLVNLIS